MKKLYLASLYLFSFFPKKTSFSGQGFNPSWFGSLFLSLAFLLLSEVTAAQSVVVNKYRNAGAGNPDIVELLVIQDQADLRGLILKDFSGSNGGDSGGSRTFKNDPLWNGLRAGTLIVITLGSTDASDVSVSCTDFNLNVGGNNTTYFTVGSSFDLGNNDMCMIKSGTTTLVANNIHTLRAGSAGTQWTNIVDGTKVGTTSNTDGSSTTLDIAYVQNANSVIGDFNLNTTGVLIGGSATISFGSGNNTTNTNFINFLRGPVSSAGTTITSAGFTANWGSLTGATSYRLDVSTSSTFASFVTGYNDLNVGNVSSYNVSGLDPNTTYYYRVRGVNATPTTSGNSCTQTVQTAVATPNLSINDISLAEGNAGTTNFTFTVSLSSPAPAGGVTFDITTADGTATDADNDFEPQSLTSQTIAAGQSSYTFTVVVNGDVAVEPNETFFVNITNVTGATVTDGQGQGTIQNDDTCPTPTITVTESVGTLNDGTICPNNLATLATSASGTYQWSANNVLLPAETNSSIAVAPSITTTYTVTVTNGLCVGTATQVITVIPRPTTFTVTGGGSYCPGGSGVEVGLSGSEADVTYLLYQGATLIATVPGTGNPLSFGLQTVSATYFVQAYRVAYCSYNMTGSVVINTNGPSFTATPTNGACPESEPYVTLNVPAASGYKYDISTGAIYTGTMTVGSGGTAINADPLEVDVFPSAPSIGGTQYTVRVIDVATGCYSDQTFTVSAIPVPCDCEAPPFVNFTPLNTTSCNVATVTIGYRVENGPALINTSGFLGTFSETTLNNGTGTFTYTPAPAEVGLTLTIFASIADPDGGDSCEGDTASANITINPLIEPTFFSPGTFCEGAVPTILPTTSNNGIMGTWNPSSINTSTPGNYTFVFTPNPGQCADTASVKARVVAKREPAFSVTTTYCVDDTPAALPGVSLGGDSGTWNPSSINTSSAGTFTYVFTPTPGACADTASIKVTVNAKVEPVITGIKVSYCQGETPEVLSDELPNNIDGTWSPATVNTSTPGTTTYIFTPASGECADTASVKITINPKIKPTFSILSTYCQGQTPANLPATSSNGVAGTWNPSTISTATPGTTTYVFTPDNAECTDTASVKVVVSQPVSVEAGTPQTICVNQTLDLSELNASITGGATSGTWSSSGTGSFTGGTAFGTATAYVPSTADKNAGTITLTLTSADPVGPCPAVVDTVVITIRNLNCSTFPWDGGK